MSLLNNCSIDKLAELEKVILDYYLNKGYKIGVGGWHFRIDISTGYKVKEILVMFRENSTTNFSIIYELRAETTKEMFDEAIKHFKIKKDNIKPLIEFNIYQYDEFTPPFKIASFDNLNEALEELEKIQNNSIKHDEYTCFCIKEEANEPIKNS